VQAARWQKKNESLKGETLVMLPTVLHRMSDNLGWTQDLGDAYLAQEQDVMDSVQRLRKEAQGTGAVLDGQVIAQRQPCHRHSEWLKLSFETVSRPDEEELLFEADGLLSVGAGGVADYGLPNYLRRGR
jgi:transcription termination factor Rho